MRVDFKKPRGSLTKVPGRTGIFASRLLDRDHAARSEMVCRSNPTHWSRIGRPRMAERTGGGCAFAGELFRGGARLGLTGLGQTWPSGHEILRGLALEASHGTIKLPRASTRFCRKRSGARHGGAAPARGGATQRRRSSLWGGRERTTSTLRARGRRSESHRGLSRAETRRRGVGGKPGAGGCGGSRGAAVGVRLPAS